MLRQTLRVMDRDGAALANTVTATSLLHAQVKTPLPAGILSELPLKMSIFAAGRVSVSGSALNLTIDLRFGSVIIANGGTMAMTTTASKTNVSWMLWWELSLRAYGGGTAANFMHQMEFSSEAAGTASVVGEAKGMLAPSSAPAVGTGFDDTAAAALDLFGTWGTASASNSIQCHQFSADISYGM